MMKNLILLLCVFLFGPAFIFEGNYNPPTEITWYEMAEAQKLASSGEKKVLVYAEASWCGYCKKMEAEVFPKQKVQELIARYFYPVRVDIESDNIIRYNNEEMTEQAFTRSMRVSGTPTFIFIDGEGKVLGAQPGFLPADVFKALLSFVGTDAHHRISFDRYYENEFAN